MPGNEIYDIPGQHGLTIIPTPIRLDAMEGRVLRLHEVEIALCCAPSHAAISSLSS